MSELREIFDRGERAFNEHDVDAVMALYAPDVVAYDIVPPLQYVGKDAYRKDYEQFLAQYQGPIEVEYRDVHIVAGENVAFAAAVERITGTMKNGQKSTMWARGTAGYKKVNGAWLDVHDHISVPTDFETGKSLLDLKP